MSIPFPAEHQAQHSPRPAIATPSARQPFNLFAPLLAGPLRRPHIWWGLAWNDTVQSYRRTFFGPFWITLNLVIFAMAITLVFGSVFKVPSVDYAGYVVCGMIPWMWVSAMLSDMGNTFIGYGPFLRSTPIDKAIFVWVAVCKQAIILVHQLIVYAGLVVVGLVQPTLYTLLIFPFLVVLFALSIPFTAITAVVFARYRDVPRLISGSIIIVMMVTPIFWKEEMITGWRSAVVFLNPIHYVIDFIRRPLLGEPPGFETVAVVLGLTAVLWILGSLFYNRYQKYVVFWI
jgi:ABC-type polysaccharide/polyol phosphate export permease